MPPLGGGGALALGFAGRRALLALGPSEPSTSIVEKEEAKEEDTNQTSGRAIQIRMSLKKRGGGEKGKMEKKKKCLC